MGRKKVTMEFVPVGTLCECCVQDVMTNFRLQTYEVSINRSHGWWVANNLSSKYHEGTYGEVDRIFTPWVPMER